MDPKICIIIPVFNREKLVERTLNSVLAQSSLPDELIVVDNASTDMTYSTVENWIEKNRKYGINIKLLTQEKRGACCARQEGLNNADSEYLIFFDSDDEMLPHLISNARQELRNNPDADIICWSCKIKQLDGNLRVPPFDISKPIENHLVHTLLRPQGYMVRKKFLQRAGGWEKDIPVWNDFELGLRLLLQNPVIYGVKGAQALIHAQENSITGPNFSSKEGQWESTIDEMVKMVESSTHDSKKMILRILDYRRAILAAHYYKEGNEDSATKLIKTTLKLKSSYDKILLKCAYYYTRKGYRGAFRFLRPFLSLK